MHFLRERKTFILAALGIFSLNYFVDRFTKYLAVKYLKGKPPLRFFHDLMILTYTENSGAFLSLGAHWNAVVKNFVLLIIPIGICTAGLLYLMFREKNIRRLIFGGCILGGGIGNLVDRVFNDFRVIDFMNFGIGSFRTGVLNVADLSVTLGVLALLITEALPNIGKKGKRSGHAETSA